MDEASRGQAPRVIAIVGMHRSGTSCLAGSLERAGLTVGRVHTWNRYNTRGNRENQDIVDLNDEVLASNGGSWDQPPARCDWTPAQLGRARELVHALGSDSIVGFKDPRTLLTLEGWFEAVPALQCIGAFRDPRAVATSLHRRSAMAAETAIDLWCHYNRILLGAARARGFSLVDFDVTEDSYLARVSAIAQSVGLDARAMRDDPFFAQELRTAQRDPVTGPLPWRARELHWRLRRRARPYPRSRWLFAGSQ
jgi:hypothetical protein